MFDSVLPKSENWKLYRSKHTLWLTALSSFCIFSPLKAQTHWSEETCMNFHCLYKAIQLVYHTNSISEKPRQYFAISHERFPSNGWFCTMVILEDTCNLVIYVVLLERKSTSLLMVAFVAMSRGLETALEKYA